MSIYFLTGDDSFAVQKRIKQEKSKVDPALVEMNYHRFAFANLGEALAVCRSIPLFIPTQGKPNLTRLVVVDNCDFSTETYFQKEPDVLKALETIPDTTILLLIGKIDQRLKVFKQRLSKILKVEKHFLESEWRTDSIRKNAETQAKAKGLDLRSSQIDYLVEAIGRDTTRLNAELDKLWVYGNGGAISDEELHLLVACETHNVFQLAEALREGDLARTTLLVEDLLDHNQLNIRTIAALLTQFRTWLMVKASFEANSQAKDWDVAKQANVSNYKRMYYLKQEVKNLSVPSLVKAVTLLLHLDCQIKTSGRSCILPRLLEVCREFAT